MTEIIEHDATPRTDSEILDDIHRMLSEIHIVLAPLLPMVTGMMSGKMPSLPTFPPNLFG